MTNDPTSARHRRVNWKSLGWTLFALLLIFNLIFFGFDAYPIVERKWQRIGIGTLDEKQFGQKVVERSVDMLWHPHPFRINDESRYLLFEHLSGDMDVHAGRLDPEGAAQMPLPDSDWLLRDDTSPLGILALGVIYYAERSPDPSKFTPALESYVAHFLDEEKGLKVKPTNVEQTCQGIALTYLAAATGKPEYRRACDEIAQFYLESFRQTQQAIPYAVWDTDRFVLVDTLGMMGPFLLRYAALTGNTEAIDLAVFQMEQYFEHGVNQINDLPFHGYNPNRGNCPIGVATWGRGSGWLALGLQEMARWLPQDHPKREAMLAHYRNLAEALRIKQRADGTWGNMLSLAVAQVDSSATAMICNFFLYGREAGILGPEFDRPIELAYEALQKNTRTDGTLDFCQGPPISMNQHSKRWAPNRYGQGALTSCIGLMQQRERQAKTSETPKHNN